MRRGAGLVGVVGLLASGFVAAPAARADSPNAITAFLQPMSGCQVGRTGAMFCNGNLSAPTPITADPASNSPLATNTGYAICWTTAAGATLPAGASCSASGNATSSGPNFTYSSPATFPVTFDGSGGSGCTAYPNNNGNSFYFFVQSPGTCVITVTTPAATGFTATTATFTLTSAESPIPALAGPVAAASGTFPVGASSPLQPITCQQPQTNLWSPCPGVTLNWSVLTGSRSCAIAVNKKKNSPSRGSISVSFRKPGTCTVQGSYPAVPGKSSAYTSPVFTYTVTKR